MVPSQSGRALSVRNALAVTTLVVAGMIASPVVAADLGAPPEPPVEPVSQNEWSVIVSPYLWAASLNGSGAFRGREFEVDTPFKDVLKDLDLGLMGAIEITNGTFGAFVNAEYVDVSGDKILSLKNPEIGEVTVGAGTTTTMIGAGVYYRVYETALGGNTAFGAPRVFAVSPLAGLRWTRLEGDLSVAIPNVLSREYSDSVQWIDPFVGGRVDIDLSSRWNLMIEGDVGGFDIGSKISLNGQAYLGYRTHLLGHETILRLGYRALYQDYTDGGFQWDVTQHGPVIGASVKF